MDTVTTCSCGQTYTAAAFRNLPLCGYQADGDGGELELRNCACGSTISRDVPAPQPCMTLGVYRLELEVAA